ncbi:lysis system o-spanin lipoprotein Rz1 [Pseudomonas aeruginosa]|uniref:lysis system o-spanin lipoprotein Rz1 n=1 Tax=Pseudomonas aeruginosa TaxID=287 RepID=UPI00046D07A9
MNATRTSACALLLTLAVSGCTSRPPAPPLCPPMPAPPAWLLQEPPNSIERLDRIITPSATISP